MENILRTNDVLARIGVSPRTFCQMLTDGRFPAPMKISKRINGWPERVVAAWIEQRLAEAQATSAPKSAPKATPAKPDFSKPASTGTRRRAGLR